jgi:hypothetical protein
MRHLARISLLAAAVTIALPAAAGAAPIVVGEFRWDVTQIDDALFSSVYSLTGLWDGADPAPTLTGTLDLSDGTSIDWFAVDGLGGFDQVGVFLDSFPTLTATTTVFFDFGGETRSLFVSLSDPGGALLTFDPDQTGSDPGPAPVPEPGTLGLVGLGLATIIRKRLSRRSLRGLSPIA